MPQLCIHEVFNVASDPRPAPPRRAHGRAPRCIVLAPTRELAKQVAADFETIGGAHGLSCLCLYGGAQYQPQEGALRRGVDVVIGTPGRVKDHLERGTLRLRDLRFRVLDECDEMLNMGFVDDVEKILGAAGKVHGNAPGNAPSAAAAASSSAPPPPQQQSIQTLLFSATLPPWVRDITRRFLDPGHKTIDLVGTSKMKASSSVRHLLLPCHWSQRSAVVCDVVRAYGAGAAAASVSTGKEREKEEFLCVFFSARARARERDRERDRERERTAEGKMKETKKGQWKKKLTFLLLSHTSRPTLKTTTTKTSKKKTPGENATGRSIVFTETKRDADELAGALSESLGARALHGDVPQSAREATLKGFREGKFDVLVATDVAARGLDISGVELVVQCEPPKDPETYIHRSGRTGRAGESGVSVTLVDRKKEGLVPLIERRAGLKFERVGAPQPKDMAQASASRAAAQMKGVDSSVASWFLPAAQKVLSAAAESDEDADAAAAKQLARALAVIAGCGKMAARSLLTAHEGFITLHLIAGASPGKGAGGVEGATTVQRPGFAWAVLRRWLPDSRVEEIKRLTLTADGRGAVFDVPGQFADEFMKKGGKEAQGGDGCAGPYLLRPSELPELKQREGGEGGSVGGLGGGFGGGYQGRGGGSSYGGRGGGGG